MREIPRVKPSMGVQEGERGKERRSGKRRERERSSGKKGENDERRVISWRTEDASAVAVPVSGVRIWERK